MAGNRNHVKKNMDKLTRPVTHKDQKKELKRGKRKHKDREFDQAGNPRLFFCLNNDQPWS